MYPYDEKRKPGRPNAIPKAIVPEIIALYKQGLGYRAISRELKKENLSVNWSTVRRLIKNKLWIYTSCKYNSYPKLTPSNSINEDRYWRAVTSRKTKSKSSTCFVRPVDLPRFTCKYEGKPYIN